MTNRIGPPPGQAMQARQQGWLDRAAEGGEIRARTDQTGGTVVYNAKRNFVGSMVSAFKDIGASTERAQTRGQAAAEFHDFLHARFGANVAKLVTHQVGLGGRELQARDVTQAIALGHAIETGKLQRDNEAIDRVSRFDLRLLDPTGAKPTTDRGLDPRRIPVELGREVEANNGFATPNLIKWLIRDGQLPLGIDRNDPTLKVRSLPPTGSFTGGLFLVEAQNQKTHILKESGGPFIYGDGRLTKTLAYPRRDDGALGSLAFENEKIRKVTESVMGRTDRIDAPGGVTVKLGHAEATFSYVSKGTTIEPQRWEDREDRITHEVSVLRAAQGTGMAAIFDTGTTKEQQDAALALGRAMGALHRQFAGHETTATGGLRTLVHGDMHPGNAFYDSESKTVTLIDLAGASENFAHDPPGFDMLRDVKRSLSTGTLAEASKEVQDAFLLGYAENFADLTDASDQPRYSPERIRTLIDNPQLDWAPLT